MLGSTVNNGFHFQTGSEKVIYLRMEKRVLLKTLVEAFIFICLWQNSTQEDDISLLIPKDYQKGQRPNSRGNPIKVYISMYVNSFGNIVEAQMEYKMYGYFRQYWNDGRLAGRINGSVVLKGEDIAQVWRPDPFCYNARESSLSKKDEDINSMMTIDPNGDIVYSRMTSIVAECDMDLHDFPMDSQMCFLKFSSYSYSNKLIIMKWQDRNPVVVRSKNLAQFDFTKLEAKEYTESYVIGNYSIIEVEFTFKRRLGYFLIQVYAPDIFIVMLSWIVFWMDRNDMGNRMALGITTILTIMFLMGSVNAAMPRVSYAKALDWYLMISFALVFLALMECTFVFVLLNRSDKEKEKIQKNIDDKGKISLSRVLWRIDNKSFQKKHNGTNEAIEKTDLIFSPNSENANEDKKHAVINSPDMESRSVIYEPRARRPDIDRAVDSFAKGLFPLVFLVFNIFYWAIYLRLF